MALSFGGTSKYLANAIDVTLNKVAAKAVANPQCLFEMNFSTCPKMPQS
jgi:hypothetical protein